MNSFSTLLSIRGLQKYKYAAITQDNTIRILTLHPGTAGSGLEGTLEFAKLDENPSYDAISYVWGDPTRCESILLDGKSLGLTQSIADALQTIRHETEPICVWANQICINQDDISERSRQVKLMGLVYKNTSKVLVWLGRDESKSAQPAFEMIRNLNVAFRDRDQLEQFTEDQRERLHEFPPGEWWHLSVLYELPWWKRVWIGQEAGTGVPLELFWGDECLDWEPLVFVSGIFDRHHKPLRNRFHLNSQTVIYLDKRFKVTVSNDGSISGHGGRSIIYELHRARVRNATDPRDRVFALLGHHSAAVLQNGSFRFEADYTKTAAEIYADVAVRTLREYSTLETLNAVQGRTGNKTLPSWVPDWENGSKRHVMGHIRTFFRAAGDTTPMLNIAGTNNQILKIQGLEIDTIEGSSGLLYWDDFDFTHLQQAPGHDAVVKYLWTAICGNPDFSLSHRYINGDSDVLAFCQTLTAGCLILALRGGYRDKYHEYPPETWLRHGAAYLTRVLGDTGLVDDGVKAAGVGGDAFGWTGCASTLCGQRCFFRTEKGYYGLGPVELEAGDIVSVLFGGTTPFVLRPVGESYMLVGECYVYGLMNGEAIDISERGELMEKSFIIR